VSDVDLHNCSLVSAGAVNFVFTLRVTHGNGIFISTAIL